MNKVEIEQKPRLVISIVYLMMLALRSGLDCACMPKCFCFWQPVAGGAGHEQGLSKVV